MRTKTCEKRDVLLRLQIDLSCHVDLGKLAVTRRLGAERSLTDYVGDELKGQPKRPLPAKKTDIVLYGFGRIGRLLARELIAKSGSERRFVSARSLSVRTLTMT